MRWAARPTCEATPGGPPALLFRPAVFLLSFSLLFAAVAAAAADNHAGSTQVDSQALPATRTDVATLSVAIGKAVLEVREPATQQ